MKFIGMIVIGIIGLILGEAISNALKKDNSYKGDDSSMTWIIKIIVAGILMAIVYESC
jgi:uncharacterized membrane protein YeaQ/YmgE (transglycosylase-associated protein family)